MTEKQAQQAEQDINYSNSLFQNIYFYYFSNN